MTESEAFFLGTTKVWPPLALAPMAGYTGPAFRLLCRGMGAGVVYTEMLSSEALTRDANYRRDQLRLIPGEGPTVVQLFGADPARLADSARMAQAAGAAAVDLNLGCPAPRVLHSGAGAALAAAPERALRCFKAMVRAVSIPVTAKLRAGLNRGDNSYLDLARALQDAGAAALALHARTVRQAFRGAADWGTIGALVEAVSVPVLGNGNVVEADQALEMMRQTGCAAVMIGRAALRDPWLFARAAKIMEGRGLPAPPGPWARVAIMLWYANALERLHGEEQAVARARVRLLPLTRGLPAASRLRRELSEARDVAHLRRALRAAWWQVFEETSES